jgi:4-amino-4-deoxy-L-arabinose transferase-like glycosyltransferase
VRSRRDLLLVLLIALVLVGVDLGRRVLGNNDEARFAVLGQALLDQGNLFFPEIGGRTYRNKPLLLAWLIAVVSWPAGRVTQLTAVLPSAAAAVATALCVWRLGARLFGPRAGILAALVALTTQGIYVHARIPLPDMLLTAFVAASLWMLWEVVDGGRPGHWIAFYVLVGAGFWVKGPAGLLPFLVAAILPWLPGFQGARRQLRLARGAILVAVLVIPWWLLGLSSDAAATSDVLVLNQLSWYTPRRFRFSTFTMPFQHALGSLYPWVIALPAALAQAIAARRAREPESRALGFVLACLGVLFLALALSQAQRYRYYVPLGPIAALLVGWWFAWPHLEMQGKHGSAASPGGRLLSLVYAGAVAVALAVALTIAALGRWPTEAELPASGLELAVLGVSLAVMLGALIVGMRGRRWPGAFVSAWAASAVLVVAAHHWDLERYNAANDYSRVRAAIERRLPGAEPLVVWGVHGLALSFYLERPVIQVETADRFARLVAAHPRMVALVADEAGAREQDTGPLRRLWRDRLGSRDFSVLAARPPAP